MLLQIMPYAGLSVAHRTAFLSHVNMLYIPYACSVCLFMQASRNKSFIAGGILSRCFGRFPLHDFSQYFIGCRRYYGSLADRVAHATIADSRRRSRRAIDISMIR